MQTKQNKKIQKHKKNPLTKPNKQAKTNQLTKQTTPPKLEGAVL